jgi:hypothetical protein
MVLRHLGGDWGDVDLATRQNNDTALATGGGLQSVYCLSGIGDAMVVMTDAERGHAVAARASRSAAPAPPVCPGPKHRPAPTWAPPSPQIRMSGSRFGKQQRGWAWTVSFCQ